MGTGNEFIKSSQKKSESVLFDNTPQATEWIEPFVLDVARELVRDKIKDHNKVNRSTYPKATVASSEKKTGWWNTDFRDSQNVTRDEQSQGRPIHSRIPIENQTETNKPNWQEEYLQWQESGKTSAETEEEKQARFMQERIARTTSQLDSVRDTSRELREEIGLSHKEARDTRMEFNALRTHVRNLRAEIKKLTSSEITGESKEKIQELRDAIARSYKVFRKNVVSEKESKLNEADSIVHIATTEQADEEVVQEDVQVDIPDALYPRFRIVDEPKKAFGLPIQPRVRREDIKPSNSTSEFLSVVPDRALALSGAVRQLKEKNHSKEKNFLSAKQASLYGRFKTAFLKNIKKKSKLALMLPLLLTLGSDSLQNDSKSTAGFGNTISKINDVVGTKGDFLGRLGGSSVVFKTPLFETKISPKGDLEVKPKQIRDRVSPSAEEQVSSKNDLIALEKTVEQIPAVKDSVPQVPEEDSYVAPSLNYTFIPGDKINTVSEALCSMVDKNPELVDGDMTSAEAVRDFNHEIEHLKIDNPDAYEDLLDQMGITSGDIDEVGTGKTYNFAPLFDYLNSLPQ